MTGREKVLMGEGGDVGGVLHVKLLKQPHNSGKVESRRRKIKK